MKRPSDFVEFQETLHLNVPSNTWPVVLQALWHDANGDWYAAHHLVDQLTDPMAKWVHAYLHRKEGDEWNAGYWYRQAGRPFPTMGFDEELKMLVEAVLG